LRRNLRSDLHEIFTEVWQEVWANQQNSLNFGGDLDHRQDTGIVFRIRHYWEIRKVVNGQKSATHTDSSDGSTGKTCLGGGMHCPSASIFFTLIQPKTTYCLSTFRLHVGSLHQDRLPVPVVSMQKLVPYVAQLVAPLVSIHVVGLSDPYRVPYELLHTDDRHRKSVLMKTSDVKPKRR